VKRKEPTVSIRIGESEYDALIGIMNEEGLRTIREAVQYCVSFTAMSGSRRNETAGDLPDGRPPAEGGKG
jgi:hypothetical protein